MVLHMQALVVDQSRRLEPLRVIGTVDAQMQRLHGDHIVTCVHC